MSSKVARVAKVVRNFGRVGPSGIAWLAYITILAPVLYRVGMPINAVKRQIALRGRFQNIDERFKHLQDSWRRRAERAGGVIYLRDLSQELEVAVAARRSAGQLITLAELDHNGLACPLIEPFWNVDRVERENFIKRRRHSLEIVDWDGRVALLKRFEHNKSEFVNELEVALKLNAAGCSVPPVLDVDFGKLHILFGYVRGSSVREMLARGGAQIRDDSAAAKSGLDPASKRRRINEGRRVTPIVFRRETTVKIADGLKEIHRAGCTLEDVKYGNIIIEADTGTPFFVDFERALSLRGLRQSVATLARDRDREKLNSALGTDLVTAKSLHRMSTIPGGAVYAPIYVGYGIGWGQLWNPDIGIGRWRYIMAENLPVPRNGRVLDLGANNGFNALQMLRSGASEVVAVEIDPLAIEQGKFLKEVYDWADNADYRLTYIEGSHGELQKLELGRFDQVTAFCTLYYLSKEQMIGTVSWLRQLTDVFVQQANTDRLIERSDVETYAKASLEFAIELAKKNGFQSIEVIAPKGYSRPLVIAKVK